jgi:hypothetical protein
MEAVTGCTPVISPPRRNQQFWIALLAVIFVRAALLYTCAYKYKDKGPSRKRAEDS